MVKLIQTAGRLLKGLVLVLLLSGILLLGMACSQENANPRTGEHGSTRSAPPDTTPYVREAVPEDLTPGGKKAIPPELTTKPPAEEPAAPAKSSPDKEESAK